MDYWITSVAMNAFMYVVPFYCAMRGIADFRAGKRVWALMGCICGTVLIAPHLAALTFPRSEAVAWFFLGFIVLGSVGVAIYVGARTFRDAVNRKIWWTLAGGLCLLLLLLPWVWTLFTTTNQVTIG